VEGKACDSRENSFFYTFSFSETFRVQFHENHAKSNELYMKLVYRKETEEKGEKMKKI
jgi:hypothetical protein